MWRHSRRRSCLPMTAQARTRPASSTSLTAPLQRFDADQRGVYRSGMTEIQGIAARPKGDQLQWVRSIEKSEFFEVVRTHTLLGYLGSPNYGGNRNQVGWKYIQFDDRMAWEPPFGYYDAETK